MTAQTIPRVLVDSCALKHGALIGRAVSELRTILWGDLEVSLDVTFLQARMLERNAHWLRAQIPFLSSVSGAMRGGCLDAFTSIELVHEEQRLEYGANLRGDLWAGIRFGHVEPPFQRSTWMGPLTFKQALSGDHQQQFCELLLHFAREGVPSALLEVLELDDFQCANLARFGEYRILCQAVGRKRYRDAFHLWTALSNSLDFFLTTDERFLRILRKGCNREDLVRPAVSPFELAKRFDFPFVAPPVFEGEVIPY